MAQFRSTADILDLALQNGGEVTNGNSAYEAQVLNYLNRVHFAILAGGTIPVGKDATVEIDEVWPWAKSKTPLVLQLEPPYNTGNITISRGNEAGTFYPAPTYSLQDYHLSISGREEVFRIVSHAADATTFELDSAYPDESVSAVGFTAFKIDYRLVPSFIVVNDQNNKIQFQKVSGTTITGTLTVGTYTPAQLATHVAAVMTAATTVITITGAYSTVTNKFTLTSDGAGSTTLRIVGDGSSSAVSIHKVMGYDDESSTAALAQVSTYVLGGIARLIEPFRIYKGHNAELTGLDAEVFHRTYPINQVQQGYPDRFCVLEEMHDGLITVRLNKYPSSKTRIEIDHIAVPRDLKDNASSIPQVPRKHTDVLEDAATFYLMINKSDDRAQVYANLLQGKLKAMISQHRGSLVRTGKHFGQIVPRQDMLFRYKTQRIQTPYTTPAAVAGTVQTLIQETLLYSAFSAAALTKTVTVRTLAANRTLFSVLVKHNTAFSGGAISSVALDIGITSDTDKFVTSFSVSQAVSATAQDSVLTVYYPAVATAITVTATAIGADLSALTSGSVDIYFLESIVG